MNGSLAGARCPRQEEGLKRACICLAILGLGTIHAPFCAMLEEMVPTDASRMLPRMLVTNELIFWTCEWLVLVQARTLRSILLASRGHFIFELTAIQ